MAQAYKVVKWVFVPDQKDLRETVKTSLPHAKAIKLRSALNEEEAIKDFDPNQVVCYIVEPA